MKLPIKLFILLCFYTLPLPSSADLKPADQHKKTTAAISHLISNYHFSKSKLEDNLSKKIFSKYIEILDNEKIYLNKNDIQLLEKYKLQLDDAIKNQKLKPAFEIFKIFKNRFNERTKHALKLLNTDFDFTIYENFQIDRSDSGWMSEKKLNEYWHKRIKNDYLTLKLFNLKPGEIRNVLQNRYQRAQQEINKLDADDVYRNFINSYITTIDPYSNYFPPISVPDNISSINLQLAGLGLVLKLDGSFAIVSKLIPDGPADLSGKIQVGDKIVGIKQDAQDEIVNTIGLRLDDIVDMIRGPIGSYVNLSLVPHNKNTLEHVKNIKIMRDTVKLDNHQTITLSSQVIEGSDDRIAIITIPSFYIDFESFARGDENYNSSTNRVNTLLDDVIKSYAKGLLIDLRGNGGGSLSEAIELSGLFVQSGPILQTKDSSGRIEVQSPSHSKMKYDKPLAILVDRHSAAASEILAAAMQDYQRAIILGEETYGHGMIANVFDLNRYIENNSVDYGRVKMTIAKTYRLNGNSLQHKGVKPDFIFPTNQFNKNVGLRFTENTISWDAIKPAKYTSANAPINKFSKVIKKHQTQIKNNPLFQGLLKEQKQAVNDSSQKFISLQESKRKASLPPHTNIKKSEDIVLKQSLEILYDLIE